MRAISFQPLGVLGRYGASPPTTEALNLSQIIISQPAITLGQVLQTVRIAHQRLSTDASIKAFRKKTYGSEAAITVSDVMEHLRLNTLTAATRKLREQAISAAFTTLTNHGLLAPQGEAWRLVKR